MAEIPQHFLDKIQEAQEKQLEELDLRCRWDTPENQKMTHIPPQVFELEGLKSLMLNWNRLTELPSEIIQLTDLTQLYLRNNQLSALPPEISQLTNLRLLNLRNNRLSALLPEIGQLTNLTMLDLSGNQLSALLPEIGQLTNLTRLDLSRNQLSALPSEIIQLTNLRLLYLSDNQLSALPSEIIQLTNLMELNLRNSQLSALPPEIGQLTKLRLLDLSDNQLSTLPPEIGQLTKLWKLDLGENPLETPPYEVVRWGIGAVRDYFRQLQAEGVDYLFEAKLLIVGEAGTGKTSLAKKIKDPDYPLQPEEYSTRGIDVIEWDFPLPNDLPGLEASSVSGKTFRVNIWDFGGQEIYHATHQFFLTKRSLYALVADTRKEDTDFHYWLNVAELLGGDSPLLIVKNEKQDRHREIDERQLHGRFENLKEVLATNLATNRGLPKVMDEIKHRICRLPHVGDTLPKTWTRVRQALEKDPRNYVSLDEYLEICERNGFTLLKYKLQLSGYLHDLGVCLHFQDDPLLKKTVILKPEWGTTAVYRVLDNDRVIRNLGRFTHADLTDIWHEDQYALMRDELLQLMIKFQLCYRIPGTDDAYIAPQLLTASQPDYAWDEADNLILRYTYEFMPKGILTRFIVAMHKHIANHNCVWRSGVVLDKDRTQAEVVEYYEKREIRVRVTGKYKRDLLTIVIHELDQIHDSFHRLKYDRWMPCNCPACKGSQSPHDYPYATLRQFLADGQEAIQCQKSYQMVNVRSLIDDVMGKERVPGADLSQLRQVLAERLSEDELKTFCSDLDVDYENLSGDNKAAKARELVAYLERRKRLRDLIEVGERLRPDVSWDTYR